MGKSKINYITGLRGAGALIVALYHFITRFQYNQHPVLILDVLLKKIYHYGYLPVEMFFFFSGYLLVKNYYAKINGREIDFFSFVKKRVGTFYWLMVLTTLFCVVIKLIGGGVINILYLFFNFLLLQCGYIPGWNNYKLAYNGASWFLAPLFLAYVLFYIFAKKSDKENLFIEYCIMALVGVIVLIMGWQYPVLNVNMMRGILGFSAGVCFYLIEEIQKKGSNRNWKMVLTACLILLLFIYCVMKDLLTDNELMVFTDLFVMPSSFIVLNSVQIIRRIFDNKVMINLGSLSMYIFLIHVPLLELEYVLIKKYGIVLPTQYAWFYIFNLLLIILCSKAFHEVRQKLNPVKK